MRLLIAATIAALAIAGVHRGNAQTAMTPTEKNAQSTLAKAGYSQIKDVKSGPEGVTAKATKDGKELSVVVDSSGKIKELR